MAIDRQRLKKIYSSKRVRPRFESTSGESIIYLETLVVEFINSSTESVSASQAYSNPVILTSATSNVNVYVSNVSTIQNILVIEISTSAPITGEIYVAIGEATNTPIQQNNP